jgi:23S rRNA (adenine2030-N6)-methyltransferase
VLIDPPYEQPGDYARVAEAMATVARRFPNGVVAAWYPIKHRAPVRTMHEAVRLAGIRDVVAAELWLREPTDPARLNGNGLLIRNPPFRWAEEWPPILHALLDRLGTREFGEGIAVERITDE